jgi:hypothetical protein
MSYFISEEESGMEKSFVHRGIKTVLSREFIKPGHENEYLFIWKREAAVRKRHGF